MLKPKCKLCGGDCGLICQKFTIKEPKSERLQKAVAEIPANKAKPKKARRK